MLVTESGIFNKLANLSQFIIHVMFIVSIDFTADYQMLSVLNKQEMN